MLKNLLVMIALTTGLAMADQPTIETHEKAVRQALIQEDARALEPYLAEDFVAIWPDGDIVDREEQLSMLGKTLTVDNITVDDVNIRFFGDTAIVTGRWHISGVWNDHALSPRSFTHVWVKRGDGWKLVSRHFSAPKI